MDRPLEFAKNLDFGEPFLGKLRADVIEFVGFNEGKYPYARDQRQEQAESGIQPCPYADVLQHLAGPEGGGPMRDNSDNAISLH
jgi:hypothetical protein